MIAVIVVVLGGQSDHCGYWCPGGRGRVIAVIVVVLRGRDRVIAELPGIIPTLTTHYDL